ncbi:SCO3374 family protein [Streptomyces ziwulingensis]
MVGAPLPVPPAFPAPPVPAVPFPRRPLGPGGTRERLRWWYESVLGWPTAPGAEVRLRTGVRFDVLEVPVEAGRAALERLGRPRTAAHGFPVAVRGERMLLLVAAGSAEELPGLLEWLEWGSLPLGLTAVGTGGLMDAPRSRGPGSTGPPPHTPEGCGRGAAVWLRPPEPGREVEASLPALSAVGGTGTAPDLARLVHTLATQCQRVRLAPPFRPPRPRRTAR